MAVAVEGLQQERPIYSEAPPAGNAMLLALPLEIRLQIYSHVIPLHPAKHPHLSPTEAYPPPTSAAYFFSAVSRTLPLASSDPSPAENISPLQFPPGRSPARCSGSGCGYLPSALLRTCKQIYLESRHLPWKTSEFVFINWFCSGVYAARSFLRALRPWQRDGMRWARVEVLGRDLKDTWVAAMVGGRAGGGEWMDLCGLWSGGDSSQGLWCLRLGIKGRVGRSLVVAADGSQYGDTGDGLHSEIGLDGKAMSELDTAPRVRGVLDIEADWVVGGLARMKSLRWLELEIEDDEIDRHFKVTFCVDLGEKLSAMRGERVDVVFVEKVVQTEPPKEGTVSGDPGGDYG